MSAWVDRLRKMEPLYNILTASFHTKSDLGVVLPEGVRETVNPVTGHWLQVISERHRTTMLYRRKLMAEAVSWTWLWSWANRMWLWEQRNQLLGDNTQTSPSRIPFSWWPAWPPPLTPASDFAVGHQVLPQFWKDPCRSAVPTTALPHHFPPDCRHSTWLRICSNYR